MKKTEKRVFINPAFEDKVTVLETAASTGGKYMICELEQAPGGGNFMHTHSAFEETFTVIKGVLGVMLNNKKHYLHPGESLTIPLHAPHHFFNDSEEFATCIIKFVPGHDGFIKGLAIAYGLAADGKTKSSGMPKSLTHLALLVTLTDTKPTGIVGLLFPFLKWLAGRARKKGKEEELLDKYYFE